MTGGSPPAHTCAEGEGWIMKGPELYKPTMNPKLRAGVHSQHPQLWNDACVGNGVTIRNLKRALKNAEDMIIQLKNQTGPSGVNEDYSIIEEHKRALETKLLDSQSTLFQRELETKGLRSKLNDFQQGYTKLNDQLVTMIKQDLWQLPNRVTLPELQHNDKSTPADWADHLARLLLILEDVRKDIHESKKKDYERLTAQDLEGARAELADSKAKINDLTTQLTTLNAELAAAVEEKTALQNSLSDAQIDRLGSATKHSVMLQNLEKEIGDLRRDVVEFQSEKHRLADELKSSQAAQKVLMENLAELRRNAESKTVEIAQLKSAVANADLRCSSAAQTSPTNEEGPLKFDVQRPPIKRPLSPTFGVDADLQNTSRQSTMDDNLALPQFTDSQFASQASPTPHLDELFVGNRCTTPKISTLRVTRTRRKGVNPMLDPIPPAGEDHQSAPSTPVADAEKRRTKRSKVTKIA